VIRWWSCGFYVTWWNTNIACLACFRNIKAGLTGDKRCLYLIFIFSVVSKASIVFVVDGTNRNHFDVIQKLCYNIYKLFAQGTSAAIITYGGTANKKLGKFK